MDQGGTEINGIENREVMTMRKYLQPKDVIGRLYV